MDQPICKCKFCGNIFPCPELFCEDCTKDAEEIEETYLSLRSDLD